MAGDVNGGSVEGSPAQRRRTAADVFRGRVGRAPDGVWAAPGRVNLIGEHTDYNDGFVLPIAIDRHVVAAVGLRPDRVLRAWSMQEPDAVELDLDRFEPGRLDGWAAYVAGAAWALERETGRVPGFDLVIDSSVPIAAGLSSSAALECAVALGLVDLTGADLEPTALALVAQRAEVEGVGVPVGIMDQMASMLCRRGHALFLDTRTLAFEHVPADLSAAGSTLAIVDTGSPRRLAEAAYAERRAECERAARILEVHALRDATIDAVDRAATRLGPWLHRRARHVVTENARVTGFVDRLRAGAHERLGELLLASHASLRDDFQVSSPRLDLAVDVAVSAGALGARMTGAGFGGSALALVPAGSVASVASAVEAAFAERGLGAPVTFEVVPSAAARRVR